mmetsp:Transcript_102099/g.218621  ORF Transcript_102099/g.218621 Transcript_102099/m.218621 type:complete len:340 (-) Transcript_102099:69-1088(-)
MLASMGQLEGGPPAFSSGRERDFAAKRDRAMARRSEPGCAGEAADGGVFQRFLGLGAEQGSAASAKANGRARGSCHDTGNASISLGWGGSCMESPSARSGRRCGGPAQPASQQAYAAALEQQIGARNALRQTPEGRGLGGWKGALSGARSEAQLQPAAEASMFSRMGGGMVGASARAASYGQELKAQIDARAAARASEKRQNFQADRTDDLRVEREFGQLKAQIDREAEVQAQRHRVVAERADALDRYLSEQGGAGTCSGIAPFGNEGRTVLPGGGPALSEARSVLPGGCAGGSKERVSANCWATGTNQNCGNFLSEKPTSRVLAPPGGRSSFTLGGAW